MNKIQNAITDPDINLNSESDDSTASDKSNKSNTANQDKESDAPYLNIERIYLKELSLEQPNSPKILLETNAPEVNVEIHVGSEVVQDNVYQVMITATITTSIKGKVVFLIEIKQAGIFTLRNIPDQQISPVLEINCAGVVYPYLRASLADIITRAGFAPIHLTEINFQMLHEKRMEQSRQPTISATSSETTPMNKKITTH